MWLCCRGIASPMAGGEIRDPDHRVAIWAAEVLHALSH